MRKHLKDVTMSPLTSRSQRRFVLFFFLNQIWSGMRLYLIIAR